jgi:hypothetical protein
VKATTATPDGPFGAPSLFPFPVAIKPRLDNLISYVVEDNTLPGIPSWRSPEKTATATTDGPFGAPPLFPFPVGESENAEIAAAPDIRFKRAK